MADLEQRVATLERDMSALKDRVGANEDDMKNIPELIRVEFRLNNSRLARLSHDLSEVQQNVAELQRDVAQLRDLPAKVDAMPRAIAELLAEQRKKN